jgi:hypothetical protein
MPNLLRSGLVAVLGCLLAAHAALALHRESPPAIQVTHNGTHAMSPGRSWDRSLTFSSTEDLLGNGSTGRQIFIYNLADDDCLAGLTQEQTTCPPEPWHPLQQVTAGPGNPDNPSVAVSPTNVGTVDGSSVTLQRPAWVAFDADGGFNGGIGCSAACQAHRQIFIVNLLTNDVQRITSATDGDSVRPTLSFGGGIMAFESTASLPGVQGLAGVGQVWIYERDTTVFRQVSKGSAPSRNPVVAQAGGFVAFESTAELTGDGHDTGVLQIFSAAYNRQNHVVALQPITNGNGHSRHPWMGEQKTVYFDSEATDLPGGSTTPGIRVASSAIDAGVLPPVHQYTDPAIQGDCSFPSIDSGSNHLSFLCTGDPLGNGTVGNRLFTLELDSNILAQMTGAGDIEGPISANIGNFFVAFATTGDLNGTGSCGRQIYIIDFFTTFPHNTGSAAKWVGATLPGQLPADLAAPGRPQSSTIGRRELVWLPGSGTSGSQATITTRDGVVTAPLAGAGRFRMVVGAPDQFSGQAPIALPAVGTAFPPVPVGGFGALCLAQSLDGTGVVDCKGGNPGGDLIVTQDHDTDVSDPQCVLGCREGSPCQVGIPGPHQHPCPTCAGGVCGSGFNAGHACTVDRDCEPLTLAKCVQGACVNSVNLGQPCTTDSQCQPLSECVNETLGVCNGPLQANPAGVFSAGGLQLTVPLTLALARDPGVDGKYCTSDDDYAVQGVPTTLRLTTGAVSGSIVDADDVAAAQLAGADTGAPFDCNALRNGLMDGARLVGELPQLDLPDVPGLRDVLLGLAVVPTPAVVNACTCTADIDCNSGNPCNGQATCVAGLCIPGAPVNCDDGNPCNGRELCDPSNGGCLSGVALGDGAPCGTGGVCFPHVCAAGACAAGTPLNCTDNNPCSADTCDPAAGCHHASLPNGTSCADGNVCNGAETCHAGTCGGGVPLGCDDKNPCTTDTCDPILGCQHASVTDGSACSDGEPCNGAETGQDGLCSPGTPLNEGDPCGNGDVCNGGVTCVVGVCTPGTPAADGTPCPDGSVCNGDETCGNGRCLPGTKLSCDDHDPCTDDTCDAMNGCGHTTRAIGASCSDGNPCNGEETCQVGGCTPGTPLGDGTPCPDGNLCNGAETCQSGQCVGGTPLVCTASGPCTTTSCDPSSGCHETPVDDGTPCPDGDVCNGTETCVGGVCTPSTGPTCDDANGCTTDTCDAVAGCVFTPLPGLQDVLCNLSALDLALEAIPPGAMRRPKALRLLHARVSRVRALVTIADRAAATRRNRLLRRANQATVVLTRLMRQSMRGAKLPDGMARQLYRMVYAVSGDLAPLVTGKP